MGNRRLGAVEIKGGPGDRKGREGVSDGGKHGREITEGSTYDGTPGFPLALKGPYI